MSHQFISMLALTRKANAAITAHQLVSALGVVATAGETALGVSRIDAADGEDMLVDAVGTATVIASGAITDGAEIEVGTAGTAVAKTDGITVGIALQDAADGEAFEMLLIPNATAPVV